MTTNKIGKESKLHNRSSINDNFTIISRKAVQDKSLSWKARGVLFYILSLPPGWILRQSDLVASSDKDGREATGNAIKELIKAGYLIKTEMREAGKFIGIKYTLNLVP